MMTFFLSLLLSGLVLEGPPGPGDPPDPLYTFADATYYLATVSEPSDLMCADERPDCTTELPECEDMNNNETFFVEIWVSKTSADPPGPPVKPGISCAFVDLISFVEVTEVDFAYGYGFSVLQEGEWGEGGSVVNLGACTLESNGAGVLPKWVLVARVELIQQEEDFCFGLQHAKDPYLTTSIYGSGYADPVDYGAQCPVDCE
jgi:hypothetical protein